MRALFCPLATHGFVYPAIAVATALRKRGHQVAFATSAAFQDELARHELARIPRGESDGPSFQVERWFHPLEVAMQAKHIEHAVARFTPEVVVAHPLSLGALLVRERVGIPTAVLGLAVPLWPPSARAEASDNASDATARRRAWRHTSFLGHLNEARAVFRRPALAVAEGASPLNGDVFMLQSIPELAPEPAHSLVGACQWEPPASDELQAWLAECGDQPLIYVHHGRAFDHPTFWPALVEALAPLPVRVAASLGRMGPFTEAAPAGFLVRHHLCQQAILRRAHLVICSGNSTVALGALTHGVPTLVLPSGGSEQPDIAEMLENSGTALAIAAEAATALTIRQAVRSLLDTPAYAERARALARVFATYDGPELVASLLEGLASRPAAAVRSP